MVAMIIMAVILGCVGMFLWKDLLGKVLINGGDGMTFGFKFFKIILQTVNTCEEYKKIHKRERERKKEMDEILVSNSNIPLEYHTIMYAVA